MNGNLKAFLLKTTIMTTQSLFILEIDSISSGKSSNHEAISFALFLANKTLRKGTKSVLAVARLTWHRRPILAQMPSSIVRLPLLQNKVMTLIGGEMKVNGSYDMGEIEPASAKELKKYLSKCQFSMPILPRYKSALEMKSYAAANSSGTLYRSGRLSPIAISNSS